MSTAIFLCDDIIIKVLSWLPAKEIARIRCVCKQWLFLTSDPHFIKSHCVRNAHTRISGFFLRDNIYDAKCLPLDANSRPGLPDPSLSFIPVLDNGARISVEASSNGLLICSHVVQHSIAVYYVCNPTTREFARLHVPREVKRRFSLVFSPSSSPNYKIVSMGSQIHMYSSETREWKLSINEKSLQELELELELRFHYSYPRSVYWNGALIRIGKRCIVSFDVEKECVKKLAMPSRALAFSRGVYIGVSGGKLQVIGRPLRGKPTVFYILEMDSEGSWSPLSYTVDLTPVIDLYPIETQRRPIRVSGPKYNWTRTSSRLPGLPVHFFRGGEEGGGEDGVLWLSVPGRIISYSLTNKVFTQVCDLSSSMEGAYDILYDWQNFYSFGHTLFSPSHS